MRPGVDWTCGMVLNSARHVGDGSKRSASLSSWRILERGKQKAELRSQMNDLKHGRGRVFVVEIEQGRWRRKWCWWWWRLTAALLTAMVCFCSMITTPVSLIMYVLAIVCLAITMCMSVDYKTFAFIYACVCVCMLANLNRSHHYHRRHGWYHHHKRHSQCHLDHLGQKSNVAVHLLMMADCFPWRCLRLPLHLPLPHGNPFLTVRHEDVNQEHSQCWDSRHISSYDGHSSTPNHFQCFR